jgi:hypothetical protein
MRHSFTANQVYPTHEKFVSYYVLKIKITKIGINRQFPLIYMRDSKGIHYVNECCEMYVDQTYLEDLCEFHHISFKILEGYVWKSARNTKYIRESIELLYNKRLEYKKIGSSLQECIKLIMNSAYGKTIQRPIKTKIKFCNSKKEYLKYYYNNYNRIKDSIQLSQDQYMIEVYNEINTQYTNCIFGCNVLSMSKRIMNEVMCLAEDCGCRIYYQDTDSMHIVADECFDRLIKEYSMKYSKDLIGKNMGQFHNDLPGNGQYIIKHINCGKKFYIDVIVNDDGTQQIMPKMKGVSSKAIYACASKNKLDIVELYESLYNGKAYKFDLCDGSTCLDMKKNGQIIKKDSFVRCIKRIQALA